MEIEAMIWQPGWKPTTDLEVSQLMRVLSEKIREVKRIVDSAKSEIMALESIGKEAEDKFAHLESKVLNLLGEYVMEEVDEDERKETKTQVKYKLARGEIIVNKPAFKIEKPKDDADLKVKHPQFVKTEEVFQWGEFKKNLEVVDGKVYHKKSGEIFEDVVAMEVPQSVSVKHNI